MQITILALGSRGDVLPYAVLGRALQSAGHQVILATFTGFAGLVADQNLAFHPIQGDAESLLTGGSGMDLAESGRNFLRSWRAVMHSFGAMAHGYARDLTPLAKRPADLLICQLPGGIYGADLAEKLDAPLMLAAVMPLTRTASFPMLAFPRQFASVPGYNSLTYRLAEQLVWQGYRRAINRWRQHDLRLPPLPLAGAMGQLYRQRVPVLNGFSSFLVERPSDWGEHVHITGYWFPEEPSWQPSPELRQFLDAGPPPVFVGFGSMPVRHPQQVTTLIVEALQLSGQRAVLHAGWAGLQTADLPSQIFTLDYAPYGWLFPRMAAIVHHGGSGTTHFALQAGVPSLVVPFLFDQFYWGARIKDLGVGPPPLPFKRLTPTRLAVAITHMIDDKGMRDRARVLGEQMQGEDGLALAVALVEQYAE